MNKPLFQHIYLRDNQSYNILNVDRPYFIVPWHFHPEIELMLITEGEGSRLVGDSIEYFSKGDLVLVGKNTPHCWKSGGAHFAQHTTIRAKALVALFRIDCFGKEFFNQPEFGSLNSLFKVAQKGISFSGDTKILVSEKLKAAFKNKGIKRFVSFLDLLNDLAVSQEYRILSSTCYQPNMLDGDMQRLNKVLDYLLQNIKTEINLEKIADQACMSPTAFCRYFKARTNKTVIGFLNELRVNHAKSLLIAGNTNVEIIGSESGFSNTSHFYGQFKKNTGCSPHQYRKKFEEINCKY